ncbi:MAG TPA: molybdenum cofactor carrier [Planctomycetaceae bacterium]|nr:molybdenum cofactor carrier [Planctomycetaceae bacterium]
MIKRIVSGGQTGVDRAALDAAMELGVQHGGWCPKGRSAEDGPIDTRYLLTEHSSPEYADRTRQNVLDSDGTLIIYRKRLSGGTALTNRLAKTLNKPLLRIRVDLTVDYDKAVAWLAEHQIATLNVAGPRGSSNPGLYEEAKAVVTRLIQVAQQLGLS